MYLATPAETLFALFSLKEQLKELFLLKGARRMLLKDCRFRGHKVIPEKRVRQVNDNNNYHLTKQQLPIAYETVNSF